METYLERLPYEMLGTIIQYLSIYDTTNLNCIVSLSRIPKILLKEYLYNHELAFLNMNNNYYYGFMQEILEYINSIEFAYKLLERLETRQIKEFDVSFLGSKRIKEILPINMLDDLIFRKYNEFRINLHNAKYINRVAINIVASKNDVQLLYKVFESNDRDLVVNIIAKCIYLKTYIQY